MKENHCYDCCCAQSWKALGIHEFTGKSIPEHIAALLEFLHAAEAVGYDWRANPEPKRRLQAARAALGLK